MENPLPAGESEYPVARQQSDIAKFLPERSGGPLLHASTADRVAALMIARHGADAAREAAVRLNRMIDRGNLPARDLWACIVHIIHERRRAR